MRHNSLHMYNQKMYLLAAADIKPISCVKMTADGDKKLFNVSYRNRLRINNFYK